MLNIVKNFNVLPIDQKSHELAKIYVENKIFPDKYIDDALHVASLHLSEVIINPMHLHSIFYYIFVKY